MLDVDAILSSSHHKVCYTASCRWLRWCLLARAKWLSYVIPLPSHVQLDSAGAKANSQRDIIHHPHINNKERPWET